MDTAKNSLVIFFSQIIIAVILFAISVIVSFKFGPEGKGILDLFSATIILFSAIGGLGIGTASIYLINKAKENQSIIFTNSLILGLFFSVVLDTFFLFVIWFSPSLFYGLSKKYLFILFFAIPLSLLHSYFLPFFLAKLKVLYWAFIAIFYDFFIFIGVIISVFFLKTGIDGIIYSILLSSLFTLFLIIFYISKIIPLSFIFDKKILIKQIKIGSKVYLGGIFNVVTQKINLVIVNYFLGIANVGFYSVALSMGSILLFIPYSFQQVLYASWSLLKEEKMDKNTPQVARMAFIIGILAAVFFLLIGKFFIIFFYGKIFYPSILPFYLILLGIPFIIFANIFFNNFFARGKPEITTIILIIVLVINILLCIFLVPLIGLAGAAIANSTSYFIAAILAVLFFSKVSLCPVFDTIKFHKEDLELLKKHFFQIFESKKVLFLAPDFAIKNQKKYYREKAIKICHIVSVDITLKFMLLNQLKFLVSQGYDVFAVCSPGKWVNDIEKEGIKVKTITFKRKFFTPMTDIIACLKLYFYFRKEKFQIVHTHTIKPEVYGQIIAKLAGVPIIINTLHGFGFGEVTPFLKKKFFIILEKIVSRCPDLVFSVSKMVIKTAIEEKIYRSSLLKYLGRDIDTDRFNPEKFSKDFIYNKKKQLGIKQSGKVLGIAARMVKEKGYIELFEAIRTVLIKFPDIVLLVIGQEEPSKKDAIYPDIVKKYNIQDNVMFLGEKTDINEIYCLMDMFVLPTHREGIGASILEASAMERPVIVTNTGGCPEAVDNGKTGILVPIKNSDRLAKAIIYLLKNPSKAQQMGKAGRKKILKEFETKIVFKRLGAEYDRLIKEKI